jgi:hypothetical protein
MKARKTVQIKALLDYANNILANETCAAWNEDFRSGICNMIETALMAANAYSGYRYLNESELKTATPGIRFADADVDDSSEERYSKNFTDSDCTRRHYFT